MCLTLSDDYSCICTIKGKKKKSFVRAGNANYFLESIAEHRVYWLLWFMSQLPTRSVSRYGFICVLKGGVSSLVSALVWWAELCVSPGGAIALQVPPHQGGSWGLLLPFLLQDPFAVSGSKPVVRIISMPADTKRKIVFLWSCGGWAGGAEELLGWHRVIAGSRIWPSLLVHTGSTLCSLYYSYRFFLWYRLP